MGTTLTAAIFDDGTLTIAHVGDSRAYLLRGDRLERLTTDHSLVEELIRDGRLTEEQAAVHPQRSIITRALGVDSSVEVDVYSLVLQGGDRVILCSDGLTSMVRPASDRRDPPRARGPDRGRERPRRRGERGRRRGQHHRRRARRPGRGQGPAAELGGRRDPAAPGRDARAAGGGRGADGGGRRHHHDEHGRRAVAVTFAVARSGGDGAAARHGPLPGAAPGPARLAGDRAGARVRRADPRDRGRRHRRDRLVRPQLVLRGLRPREGRRVPGSPRRRPPVGPDRGGAHDARAAAGSPTTSVRA